MPWAVAAAAVTAAGTAYSANKSANAAEDAAKTAQNAAERAYVRNQANLQPFMDSGASALGYLDKLAAGDYSGFMDSPDYRAIQQTGIQSLDRSAAARGALNSGGADADRIAFGANLGAQQLGNYRGFLTNLAQIGQNAAGNLAGVGNTYANATANNAYNVAGAQSDAAGAQSGAVSGFLNSLLSQYGGSGGNTRASSYPQTSLLANQAATGPGSVYNFGNNVGGFAGGGW